jgi:hypothetical protein
MQLSSFSLLPFALARIKKLSYLCGRNVNFLKFEAIEELTLYILQQEKRIKELEQVNK